MCVYYLVLWVYIPWPRKLSHLEMVLKNSIDAYISLENGKDSSPGNDGTSSLLNSSGSLVTENSNSNATQKKSRQQSYDRI